MDRHSPGRARNIEESRYGRAPMAYNHSSYPTRYASPGDYDDRYGDRRYPSDNYYQDRHGHNRRYYVDRWADRR
jgi:hypothetical protein